MPWELLKCEAVSRRINRRTGSAALLLITILVASGSLLYLRHVRGNHRSHVLPPVILWAWERPEDLRFIDPGREGVAYLAATIALSRDRISLHSRQQQLQVPDGTTLVAVVRIETDRNDPPVLSDGQRSAVAGIVSRIGSIPAHAAVQIDFDALTSERAFYRALLHEVRGRLPASVALSITALASWCTGDPWIAGLPVDEAVPMLFRMGADRAAVLARLQAGADFSLPICRASVGISTDEPRPPIPAGRRIYVFTPQPWKAGAFISLNREIGK